ncbi:hypothetical protein FPQ18DRAFT_391126 [Pyronema domesticum]|nr:hypothetical protein FPQ18DRAFT_391126 [Pyronema domesticum]
MLRPLDSTHIDPDTCIPTPSVHSSPSLHIQRLSMLRKPFNSPGSCLMLFEASISLSVICGTSPPHDITCSAAFHRRNAA